VRRLAPICKCGKQLAFNGPPLTRARCQDVATDNHKPVPQVFEDREVSLAPLAGKRVAILGYGAQGRAQGRNLHDSGIEVVIGLRSESERLATVQADGLACLPVAEAAAAGDVVVFLVPDEVQADLYREVVAPGLKPDAALAFSHGFAIAFGQIEPPPGRPCFLVAPKGQGDKLRTAFENGSGLPGLLAVTDGSPPGTWELAASYAKAVGCLKGGGLRTTFREECVTDQFGEQVVLCGGVIELLQAAFTTLVSRGYGAENAYFECVHELKIIADLLHRHGVDGMRSRISGTAAYGGLTRGPRLIDRRVRDEMDKILDEIESGAFAREFLAKYSDPARGTAAASRQEADSPLARAGRALRERLQGLDLEERPPEKPSA